jgi:arylformamidase
MKIYDISVEINPELPVWPGDHKLKLTRSQKLEAGDNANVSQMELGLHTGTHVDAPFHFLEQGVTLDKIALERLVGPVTVLEVPQEASILSGDVLAQLPADLIAERVLFKTRNSSYWSEHPHRFHKDFVAFDQSGADFMVEKGVRLVGIDYLSIAPFRQGKATHEILLGAGVVILEGLDLSGVSQGEYQLYCLPLKIGGVEGAPVRAILVKD